jgi:prevent-host-death family protein
MYIPCTRIEERDMAKRVTTAQARREWAKVLRSVERGTPVTVTRNGQPVAVVISIDEYRRIGEAKKETLADVFAQFRESVDPSDLDGPDPWAEVRDRSPGRDVRLG